MATKEINIYSCNCFFDVCLLSYSKKEDFKQLSNRIRNYCDKKYKKEKKHVSCPCSNCTFPYKKRARWVLRETNYEFFYENIYVVCKNYLSYILSTFSFASMKRKK